MSDHFIALIPAEPQARPSPQALAALKTTHADICDTDECRIKDYGEKLQFIDCGTNFDTARCPHCDSKCEKRWWGQRMDHAWDDTHGFHLCDFEMPCCGAASRLDALDYRPAQGFATWFVSARDQGRNALTDAEQSRLEHVAGIPLRAIYQCY